MNRGFTHMSPKVNSIRLYGNLIQFLARKFDQGPVFFDGMVNSTEVVVHPKTNVVMVV